MIFGRSPIASAQREGADFGVEESRYRDWIAFVFDRPSTSKNFGFEIDPWPPERRAGPSEIVGLIGQTAARSGIDLTAFDDMQVYRGLDYLFSGTGSQHVNNFARDDVPIDLKVAALRALKILYSECLELRCSPFLGYLNEISGIPLNKFTYMLWDTTSLHYVNRNVEAINNVILEVMEFTLGLNNDACLESALHGLGHAHLYSPRLVEPIIDRFLDSSRDSDPSAPTNTASPALRPLRRELRAYARRARNGGIS